MRTLPRSKRIPHPALFDSGLFETHISNTGPRKPFASKCRPPANQKWKLEAQRCVNRGPTCERAGYYSGCIGSRGVFFQTETDEAKASSVFLVPGFCAQLRQSVFSILTCGMPASVKMSETRR